MDERGRRMSVIAGPQNYISTKLLLGKRRNILARRNIMLGIMKLLVDSIDSSLETQITAQKPITLYSII